VATRGWTIDTGVSIVIPAFNEAHRLPTTLDRLLLDLPTVFDDWEVVVIDDGSTDGTGELVESYETSAAVRVVTMPANEGKGAALRTGVAHAGRPLVLFLDADLPVAVAALGELVEGTARADLVVGSRRIAGSSSDPPQPFVRRLGGAVFIRLVRSMGYDITSDPQCGVKAMRRESVGPIVADTSTGGFAFDAELIDRCRRSGLTVTERPVAWRHVEGSTLRPFRDVAATLRELWRIRRRPAVAAGAALTP